MEKATSCLLHKTVTHKTFGQGNIVAYKQNKIDVLFSGSIVKCFIFPDAFLGLTPFLSTKDDDIKSLIQELKQHRTCVFCRKEFASEAFLNDDYLCTKCAPYGEHCEECETLLDKRDLADDTFVLCQDCFDKLVSKCSNCGLAERIEDLYSDSSNPSSGKLLCFDCAMEQGFVFCSLCNQYIKPTKLTKLSDGKEYCPTCIASYGRKCEKCGVMFISEHQEKECDTCCRQSQYLNLLKAVDFSALKTKTIWDHNFYSTPTLELMTELRSTKPREGYQDFYPPVDYLDALLIDVYSYGKLVVVYGEPFPLTVAGDYYQKATLSQFKKDHMANKLMTAKHRLLAKLQWPGNMLFEVWDKPFRLCAQTYFDMDYRKEWRYGIKIYEGNNYGDTSKFLIIGAIKNK